LNYSIHNASKVGFTAATTQTDNANERFAATGFTGSIKRTGTSNCAAP
jgi:hypothetical protein